MQRQGRRVRLPGRSDGQSIPGLALRRVAAEDLPFDQKDETRGALDELLGPLNADRLRRGQSHIR